MDTAQTLQAQGCGCLIFIVGAAILAIGLLMALA